MIALALLALWIVVGTSLLVFGTRSRGAGLRRSLSARVIPLGRTVRVTLLASPPVPVAGAPDHDVILLLDHSGSMGVAPGSPLREMQRVAGEFVRNLPANVHVAIVRFDDTAECLCALTGNKRRAIDAIGRIGPGAGTSIAVALDRAGDLLAGARPEARTVVVLFTDGLDNLDDVRAAAGRLREHPRAPGVLCASFGGDETRALMETVASDPGHVFHSTSFDGLVELFTALAAEVSGRRALSGLLHEEGRAPAPFALAGTGENAPLTVDAAKTTRLVWSLPQFDGTPKPIQYDLEARRIGWHAVAASPGEARWRMPDGTIRAVSGPRPARVLVLPRLLSWAWPVANPLLFLLLAPLLRDRPVEALSVRAAEPEPVDVRLPEPLPAPTEAPYRPVLRPRLVIGLGRPGIAVLNAFAGWLDDREASGSGLSLLGVAVGEDAGDVPAGIETIRLDGDLWPYVDDLRRGPLPEERRWIPRRRWLAAGQPLTTGRGARGDRALARLTALLRPETLESTLARLIPNRPEDDQTVYVVGSVADATATGLLAEIAHICAGAGAAVSPILLNTPPGGQAVTAIAAFARELHRFLVRRGDPVVSDRGGVPHVARHLFDQAFVAGTSFDTPVERRDAAVALLWSLVLVPSVAAQFPPRNDGAVYAVNPVWWRLPQRALWEWVRARTLEQAVLRNWLGFEGPLETLTPAKPPQAAVRELATAFWNVPVTGDGPRFLSRIVAVACGTADVGTLMEGAEGLPSGRPYHEQRAFCDEERRRFGRHLETWCRGALEQRTEGVWPLSCLHVATMSIRSMLSETVDRLQPYTGDGEVAAFVSFASMLLVEMQVMVSRLSAAIEGWSRVLVETGNPQGLPAALVRDIAVNGPPAVPASVKDRLEEQAAAWTAEHTANLLSGLAFVPDFQAGAANVVLELRVFDRRIGPSGDVAGALRQALDPYRWEILSWPDESWAEEGRKAAVRPGAMAAGKRAARVFGDHVTVLDDTDPACAIAIEAEAQPLDVALGLHASPDPEEYVWPEEANAERLASLVRLHLLREPAAPGPHLVALMRRTEPLLAFLIEVASGKLGRHGGFVTLDRGGRRFPLAACEADGLDAKTLTAAAQQAVIAGRACDGEELPPAAWVPSEPWVNDPNALVAAFDAALGLRGVADDDWDAWRDALRGVALDQREGSLRDA